MVPVPASHDGGSAFAGFVDDTSSDEGPELDHSGCNSQGNYYESYADGSYHYDNQDGSTYDCDADGHATYASPTGDVYEYDAGGYSGVDHSDEGYSGGGHYD